jgi:phosphomannomutase
MPIHFGTDGWRAVISDSFTFDNLRIVAQAIADAVASGHWDKSGAPNPKKIVIGYDTRFLSDRFAGEVARVLAANGFTVILAQSDAPTPAISFSVKHQGAVAGIMITASHNAPRYNGVKLKAAFGGSALSEQCRSVEVYINDNEERARGPNLMDYNKAREAGLPAYFDHLRTLINTDIIAENPQRFCGGCHVWIGARRDQIVPARHGL